MRGAKCHDATSEGIQPDPGRHHRRERSAYDALEGRDQTYGWVKILQCVRGRPFLQLTAEDGQSDPQDYALK